MMNIRPAVRGIALCLLAATALAGCLWAVDDQSGREKVIPLVEAGALGPGPGFDTLGLPDDLAHLSNGGEVVEIREGDALIVVFFDFRGLNHYTGWVYRSTGDIGDEDPLGNRPFTAKPIAPHWWRVDAG
jgi:hypothetical protein